MKSLYIDESGTYNQDITKLDPNLKIFLLTGIVIDPKFDNELLKEFKKLKKKFFGREDVIFHSREFVNPTSSKQRGVEQFQDIIFRHNFYTSLNKVIAQIQFKICGFTVHTEAYLKALKANQPDPYLLGIETTIDSFIELLNENEEGQIIAESRANSKDNNSVLNRWKTELILHKRVGLTTEEILQKHHISKPQFLKKDSLLAGLELVDLIGYYFARGLANKDSSTCENGIPMALINSKIHKYFSLPTHPHYYLKQASSVKT